MAKPRTNTTSLTLAEHIAAAPLGSFVGLVYRNKGTVKGGVEYGRHLKHSVIISGFRYDRLCQRSLDRLQALTDEDKDAKVEAAAGAFTRADLDAAYAELEASLTKSRDGENHSTTDHVYVPLVLDGLAVRGARVYVCVAGRFNEDNQPYTCHCRNCTGDQKAPLPGTTYLKGLLVGARVVEQDPNGDAPPPKSAAKTLAKNALSRDLPSARFVQYALEVGGDWILRAGGAAAHAAHNDHVELEDATIEDVFELSRDTVAA